MYDDYIILTNEVNQFSQELLYKLDVHNECAHEILSATYYSVVLSTYQACLLLSFKGMRQQFHSLLRCMLEPLFPLAAIFKENSFANVLILSEGFERYKNINKLIRFYERNKIDSEELEEKRKLAADLKAKIDSMGIAKVSAYDCALKADLEDLYDTLYSHTSIYLHAGIRSLEENLILDNGGQNITALKCEPEIEGFHQLYSTLIQCMLISIEAVSGIFKIENSVNVQRVSARLTELNKHLF